MEPTTPSPALVEADAIVRNAACQEAANRRVLTHLLDGRLERRGHFIACRMDLREVPSYFISAPLEWVSWNVRFAHAGLWKRSEEVKAALKVGPDWSRRESLITRLIAGDCPDFPALTVVGHPPDADARASGESVRAEAISEAGALFDVDLLDMLFYAVSGEDWLLAIYGLRELIRNKCLSVCKPNGAPVPGKMLTLSAFVRAVRRDGESETDAEERIESVLSRRIGVEIVPAVGRGESPEASESRLSSLLISRWGGTAKNRKR